MQMQWRAFNFQRMEGELMIENIGEFLANSSNIYLFLAIFGSVIFILQFILSHIIAVYDHNPALQSFAYTPSFSISS